MNMNKAILLVVIGAAVLMAGMTASAEEQLRPAPEEVVANEVPEDTDGMLIAPSPIDEDGEMLISEYEPDSLVISPGPEQPELETEDTQQAAQQAVVVIGICGTVGVLLIITRGKDY